MPKFCSCARRDVVTGETGYMDMPGKTALNVAKGIISLASLLAGEDRCWSRNAEAAACSAPPGISIRYRKRRGPIFRNSPMGRPFSG